MRGTPVRSSGRLRPSSARSDSPERPPRCRLCRPRSKPTACSTPIRSEPCAFDVVRVRRAMADEQCRGRAASMRSGHDTPRGCETDHEPLHSGERRMTARTATMPAAACFGIGVSGMILPAAATSKTWFCDAGGRVCHRNARAAQACASDPGARDSLTATSRGFAKCQACDGSGCLPMPATLPNSLPLLQRIRER